MKKLTVLLLLLCILAGCAAPAVPTESTEESSSTAFSAEESIPELTTIPAPLPDLLDGKTPVEENSSLYRLKCPAIEKLGAFSGMYLYRDCLLIMGYAHPDLQEFSEESNNCILSLVDLKTGQIRAETRYEETEGMEVQICSSRIALKEGRTGTIHMLNGQLQEVESYQVSEPWCPAYIDASETYTYVIRSDNTLVKTELATGRTEYLLKGVSSLYGDTLCGDLLTIHYLNSAEIYESALLNLASGELEEVPMEGACTTSACMNGLWLALSEPETGTYLFGRGSRLSALQDPNFSCGLIDGPAALQSVGYPPDGGQKLQVYREDGTLLASCAVQEGYLSNLLWCPLQNGYLLTSFDTEGKTSLLLWDVSAGSKDETALNLVPLSGGPETGSAVASDLYERAAAISRKYGITVHIADRCTTEYHGFHAERELDYWTISAGLEALDTALAVYPEGFFDQLQYGYFKKVEIHLCGNLTAADIPENANGYTLFSAFVSHENNRQDMVLDIRQPNLQQTIFHEFSHVMDAKLEFLSEHRETIYSEERWQALNPPDFTYTGSLFVIPEEYRTDGYNGWFIDTYARTFSTEDRARVLEYAMSGYDWMFCPDLHAPLQKKLAFYSAAIRDAFDTEGWPEVTAWERPLNGYSYKSAA